MIYLLFGKSGAGKTTVYKRLIEDEDLGLTPIVTCTTRPPREGEVNEVDYYFISEEEFHELNSTGELMESTSYEVANGDTWYYGSLFKDFWDSSKDKLIIVNPHGIREIIRKCLNYSIPTKVILLTASRKKRLQRLSERGDNIDEIKRRMKADDKDFFLVNELANHKINTTRQTIDETVNKIKKIISKGA